MRVCFSPEILSLAQTKAGLTLHFCTDLAEHAFPGCRNSVPRARSKNLLVSWGNTQASWEPCAPLSLRRGGIHCSTHTQTHTRCLPALGGGGSRSNVGAPGTDGCLGWFSPSAQLACQGFHPELPVASRS